MNRDFYSIPQRLVNIKSLYVSKFNQDVLN